VPNTLDDVVDADRKERAVAAYLGRVEVAERIGLKSVRSLSGMVLPPHDVEIGVHRGWKPETIDAWQSSRPGRGRWGPRGIGGGYATPRTSPRKSGS
jgi:hypothetical protein